MTINKQKTYTAEIKIWSRVGHTPITGRKGAYCDTLLSKEMEVNSIDEVKQIVSELIKKTKHGYKGAYNVPNHPNQNIRTGFL